MGRLNPVVVGVVVAVADGVAISRTLAHCLEDRRNPSYGQTVVSGGPDVVPEKEKGCLLCHWMP